MENSFRNGKYFLPGLVIVFSVIFVDQYTKWLVMEALLRPNGPVSTGFVNWFTTMNKIGFFVNEREQFRDIALSPLLNLVMVWNQGISFGILDSNSPHMPLAFIALSLVISLMMLLWLAMSGKKIIAVALSLIIGGALGNVIDRVRFDAVADFIDFHFKAYHWPAFNVADSCIVMGAGILMLCSLLDKERTKEEK